ncbi:MULTISPECIES: LCP family protein [Lacticaseibacillus]|uniref:LCP family protein n=2 Tax=Lacticaseibacillus TaxID=2759736 RepID=A0AAN1EZT3_LACCA|nr:MULTISPECIES: LCP family protein [Lacticaseibacillus]ARY92173.1 LytR family transcriptional regulator [Lacticaseibacillus casei]KAB1971225.1 LytR family transcriptional regulator [Lacticaseibacillus casei]WLV80080.1 LCP family protein [Lacticaseibacillus sp. NCIMB 15473]WNX24039.1 LCP family protein [Lacticaseibacillus casei]WNX26813.1 LCP family protein [Lacticaseibacillus casei]
METRSNHRHRQPPKRFRWGRLIGLIVIVGLFTVGAYALRLYSQAKYAIDNTYHATKHVSTNIAQKKPFAVLLLGVDTGADGRVEKGNSDTIIVAVINPKTNKTTMVSIPRDTAAELIGTKEFNMQKINAAYNVGGSDMAINTVSKLVNVPISYYLTINMGALEKVVNAVGGIDVNVPFSFQDPYTGNQKFTKGHMHLNGNMALAYSRMRHEDPQGDYGRQQRQQQVIKAILKKAVSVGSLGNFTKLMDTISKNIATNLSFADMQSIFMNYRGAAKTISTDHLKGVNAWVGDGAYQIASDAEMQRVSDKLRKALGLQTETISNEETKQNAKNTQFDFKATTDQNYIIFTPYDR